MEEETTRYLHENAQREVGIDDIVFQTHTKKQRSNGYCIEMSTVGLEEFRNTISGVDDGGCGATS